MKALGFDFVSSSSGDFWVPASNFFSSFFSTHRRSFICSHDLLIYTHTELSGRGRGDFRSHSLHTQTLVSIERNRWLTLYQCTQFSF